MNFTTLQDRLRQLLLNRISAGELTGMALAARAGFQQAHVSNFLNRKRSLSLAAMDKVLDALHLSALDLADLREIDIRASAAPDLDAEFQPVPLVDLRTAAHARVISRDQAQDFVKFKSTFLHHLRSAGDRRRKQWTRFVLITADRENSAAMQPRLRPGATLLIDRHYNSLKSYRRGQPNLYLVCRGREILIRYVAVHRNLMVLRPQVDSEPLLFEEIAKDAHYPDVIIGRVCHVGMET